MKIWSFFNQTDRALPRGRGRGLEETCLAECFYPIGAIWLSLCLWQALLDYASFLRRLNSISDRI